MNEHKKILEKIYNEILTENFSEEIPDELKNFIEIIVSRSENNKGIITVLITLLSHKIFDKNQDIRYHQAQLKNGFAGRVIDKAEVTPFMKSVNFPAMSESGWLTRSLEQPHAYDLNYPGKITPKNVKNAFLQILNEVEVKNFSAEIILKYIFYLLIKQRDELKIDMAKPHSLSIANIINLLRKHFTFKYSGAGASRLPTLAIYAAYQCMMNQVARYEEKILCPLESHTSADFQSGRIGDIEIKNSDETAFEGVEIKHEITITKQIISDAYEKFKIYNTDRYYILTTAEKNFENISEIEEEIHRIEKIHGCQVIVNGVYDTLKYYLRLLKDTSEFISNYVELLKVDDSIKFLHKKKWNDFVAENV